jgi:hypothetical protein
MVITMYETTINRAANASAKDEPGLVKNAELLAASNSAPAIAMPCMKTSPGFSGPPRPAAPAPICVKLSMMAGTQLPKNFFDAAVGNIPFG